MTLPLISPVCGRYRSFVTTDVRFILEIYNPHSKLMKLEVLNLKAIIKMTNEAFQSQVLKSLEA